MFPGPHDQIYRNEAGEVLGWDKPAEPEYIPFEEEAEYYGYDDEEEDE